MGESWLAPGLPSIVARPEIVIEGFRRIPPSDSSSSEGGEAEEGGVIRGDWVTIPFRYKPGDVSASPPWVSSGNDPAPNFIIIMNE